MVKVIERKPKQAVGEFSPKEVESGEIEMVKPVCDETNPNRVGECSSLSTCINGEFLDSTMCTEEESCAKWKDTTHSRFKLSTGCIRTEYCDSTYEC